ncbi:MAG TPA: hemolysin III family protein, partial [Gemmatimonadaceae bacterium]|nr:hemolysin III family protein [Gemmatimonadaceae bacterium]
MISSGLTPSGVNGFFIREQPSPSQGNTDTAGIARLLSCIIDTRTIRMQSSYQLSIREPVNALTHLLGAVLAAIGMVVLLVNGAANDSARQVVAFAIFGTSLVLLYSTSGIYHSLNCSERGLAMLRRLDHMMIYVLIAGTYTPVCLVLLRGSLGVTLLIVVWIMALAGVVQKLAWMHAPRWFSTVLYLGMGWAAMILAKPLLGAAPLGFFLWIIAGGLFYSVGAVVYATKWPNPAPRTFGFHEIWHLFV